MLVLLGIALCLAACSGPGNARTDDSPAQSPPQEKTDGSDEASDLEALYWARQDSARTSFIEADVRFMTGMIKHHAQAVVMSRLAPTHGASGQVQTLAARIINAQQDEIATMQRWLRRRDQPVPQIEMEGTRLTVDGMSVHGMNMVGVLTEEQIRELDRARGTAFDRLFLKYMIQHHSGAVTMVDNLVGTDGAARDGAAFKLASDINVDQQTEIARMRRVLSDLPDAGSTP
jgi:uncharacterized protein (DUF305 family)